MSMDGMAPIGSGRNARVAHIRKFVCVPPERGHTLRLVAVEDPPTVLGEWPRAQCEDNGVTADDVDARLRDHANTTGDETTANLTWCAENSLVVCSKRLRCKPENDATFTDPASQAQAEAMGVNGTAKGEAIQLGRALEGHIRLYMSNAQTDRAQALAAQRENRELVQTLGTMLKESWSAAHAAHLELDKLRAQQRREIDQFAAQLRDAAESDSEDAAESGARAEFLAQLTGAIGKALPFILQQAAGALLPAKVPPPSSTGGGESGQ